MKMLKIIAGTVGVIVCLYASSAVADTASIRSFVERTLVRGDANYGGCAVLLSKDPAAVLPACGRWLTFSCDGTFTDPVRGYRMLDQAQLAVATGMEVTVSVDDSKQIDTYCFVSRITLISP